MTKQIDIKRIEKRIREIEKRLLYLKKSSNISEEVFEQDHLIRSAIERDLEIIIQACLDIADHLISGLALDIPKKDRKETFTILAKEGIIPNHLISHLTSMAGQRNILIHEYLDIDPKEILRTVKEDLHDVVEYVSFVQKFIDTY